MICLPIECCHSWTTELGNICAPAAAVTSAADAEGAGEEEENDDKVDEEEEGEEYSWIAPDCVAVTRELRIGWLC